MVMFKDEKEKQAFCSFLSLEIDRELFEQKRWGVVDNPHSCWGTDRKMIDKIVTRYENGKSKGRETS